VAVHGFAQTGRCWGTVPADFAALGFEVVTPDVPGHGSSPHPALDLPTTAAVLGELGGRATYLGYSFGGRICLRLAVDRPDLVERLILVGATAGIDGVPDHRRYSDERRRNTVTGLAASLRRAGTGAQEPLWANLHRLEMPVLVVTGELDAKFDALGDRLARGIGGNATRAVVAGAGHTVHLEQPARFRAAVETWLSTVDAGRRPGADGR
jgi:2-succinyl-6-hydroxy-2,4-cyclohexadiene-1-carboxylate synthase